MRPSLKPAASLFVAAAVICALTFGVHYYRYRFVRSDADLVGLLPQSNLTLFFADVAAVRKAGLLDFLAQTQGTDDSEYRQFIQQTGFSYQRDLDSLTGTTDGKQIFLALQGHFDWLRLRKYATQHGGQCQGQLCSAPTSQPGRWASYQPIQPNVMALAVSENQNAASFISGANRKSQAVIPSDPVWVKVSRSILKNPLKLPLPIRIFAISLQSADSVILSVSNSSQIADAFDIRLHAWFPNEATAEATRNQLEIQTKMLKLELNRESKRPNVSDLSGLMTSGVFQVVDKSVVGSWPVRRELLRSLE